MLTSYHKGCLCICSHKDSTVQTLYQGYHLVHWVKLGLVDVVSSDRKCIYTSRTEEEAAAFVLKRLNRATIR